MPTAFEHYDQHLGPIYTWTAGALEAAIVRNRQELAELGLGPVTQGIAVDLGAGPGGYAIPFAEWGYSTVAIDTCSALLDEMRGRAGTLPIHVFQDDLLSFRHHCDGKA